MKVKLVGKNLEDIKPLLHSCGLHLVDENPALIVAHGGDGTLLMSEREFPSVPKLPVRDSRTAPLCPEHSYQLQLNDFTGGRTAKVVLPKLVAEFKGQRVTGINDIFIHNFARESAVRYRVWINDELYSNEVVGDGAGVATVHGSTAYYRSITHSTFRVGLGLAFSNSTEVVNHLVIPEDAVVKIEIIRGPAVIVADNSPEQPIVEQGDNIVICKAVETATIYGLDKFMCPECRNLRHSAKYQIRQL